MQPNKLTTRVLEKELERLIEDCPVVDAATVASLDGRLLARAQKTHFPLDRLAVMGGSLMGLGDTITAELGLGTCERIVAENENGLVVFVHVAGDLVLVSLTTRKNSLGMLLSCTRKAQENLRRVLTRAEGTDG
jgi:predicted regulator of Ras-like GTPase activity (Roadblock/LC7/MglB family)